MGMRKRRTELLKQLCEAFAVGNTIRFERGIIPIRMDELNHSSSRLRHRIGGSTATRQGAATLRKNVRRKPLLLFQQYPTSIRISLVMILAIVLIALQRYWVGKIPIPTRHSTKLRHSYSKTNGEPTHMSFRDFPSLQKIVSDQEHSAPLMALYFAASWCPMSTKPTQLLDDLLREHLLSNATLILVYVSSDINQDSFQAYLRPGWRAVPFHNSLEISSIQRYFHTCAKREMKALGLLPDERLHEIPHLYIVSTTSGRVLSSDGLADVREHEAKVLSHWQDLQSEEDGTRFAASIKEAE
jgi:Thioredoxin-like